MSNPGGAPLSGVEGLAASMIGPPDSCAAVIAAAIAAVSNPGVLGMVSLLWCRLVICYLILSRGRRAGDRSP